MVDTCTSEDYALSVPVSPRILSINTTLGGTLRPIAEDVLEATRFDREAIASFAPHVALIGVNREDDIALLRTFKEHHPHLPTVAVVEPRSELTQIALGAGANDVIPELISSSELESRIGAQLRIFEFASALGQRERSAELLLEISHALTSSLDIYDILFTVVSRVAQVVDATRASIVLAPEPESSDEAFVLVASDDDNLHNLRLDLGKYPEIRQVLRTKQLLTINDARSHPLLDGVQDDKRPSGSVSVFPIAWKNQAMGVLFLRTPKSITEHDAHLCWIITNTAAVALRNARVMHKLKTESEQVAFERFEAERQARSLKRYADLFAAAAEGIAVLDERGRLLFANPRAYEITGHGQDWLSGRRLRDLLHPEHQEVALEIWRNFATAGYPRSVDLKVVRADGETIVCDCSFAPLSESEGAVLLTFQDVTQHRQTQAELDQTREFLESLVDASVDGIIAADMSGKIILFNQSAERIYGYPADLAVGQLNVRKLYPGDGARRIMKMLLSEDHGGVGRLSPIEIEVVSASGELIPVLLSAAVIYEKGTPIATFGIFTDQRQRRQVEERLAVAQSKLAKTEKQAFIAELAGATAHELNQPLTSIMAYSELLKRKFEPDTSEHRAAMVLLTESERMAEIVRKIGKITRYETTSYVGEQRILDLDKSSEG